MRTVRWILLFLLLAGAGAAGFWALHNRKSQTPTLTTENEEKRAQSLYDSLSILDFEIRQAQESLDSVPQALIEEQTRLWSRYADARSRLAALHIDSVQTADPTQPTTTALTPVVGFLHQLTGWIWGIAGAAALFLGVFLWLLMRKPKIAREAVSFPKPRTLRESLAPWDAPSGSTDPTASFQPDPSPDVQSPRMPPLPLQPARPVEEPTLPRRTVDPTFAASSWENTRTTPPSSAVEPSAMQDMILSLSKRGHTPAEIARRLRLPQDQVSLILKLRQAL